MYFSEVRVGTRRESIVTPWRTYLSSIDTERRPAIASGNSQNKYVYIMRWSGGRGNPFRGNEAVFAHTKVILLYFGKFAV